MVTHNQKLHYVFISVLCVLSLLCMIGISSCQQPVSRPSAASGSGKSSKKNPGEHTKPQKPQEPIFPKQPKKNEYFHTMKIPNTLTKKSEEVKETSEPIGSMKTTDLEINADGIPLKYAEKEMSYHISAAFGDNILLDPQNTTIYPGAVLVGDSIDSGNYTEIIKGKKRKALISFSLQGIKDKNGQAGITSGTIEPSLDSYRALHNEILSQKITSTASAQSSYEELVIKNESSFNAQFKLGVGFSAPGIKKQIGGGFKFNTGNNKHRHLIRFTETFYTADVKKEDIPLMTDIPREVLGNTMPVYVSSVSYGRIAYLSIESEKSWNELKPHFDAAFKLKPLTTDTSADLAIKKLSEMTTTTINIIGGSKKSVTTLAQFRDYIVNGGFSSSNPGQIIKYKLSFLGDNSVAHIKYKESYHATERTPIPAKGISITARVKNMIGSKKFGIYGSIELSPHDKATEKQTLFSKNEKAAITIPPEQIIPLDCAAKTVRAAKETEQIALHCNIQDNSWFTEHSFVTGSDGTNNPIVYTIKDVTSGGKKSVTLFKKGRPKEKITFDIYFVKEYVF